MSKTALVTGSEGFVGRHLVPQLIRHGYAVTVADPKVGITAEQTIQRIRTGGFGVLVPRSRYDLVVHLGANILNVDARMKGDVRMFKDLALDYTMCEYVNDFPPREAFILPSSCTVDSPEDPYAWVNLTREKMLKALHKRGVRCPILRPFSGYGPDQALSYPFPAILHRAMQGENPLKVWGSVNTVRDWIYIDDLIRAFLWAKDHAPSGEPVEIGTGVATPFWLLAAKIAHACGYMPSIEAVESKPTSGTYRVADIRRAKDLGFEAQITLDEGIEHAITYHATTYTRCVAYGHPGQSLLG